MFAFRHTKRIRYTPVARSQRPAVAQPGRDIRPIRPVGRDSPGPRLASSEPSPIDRARRSGWDPPASPAIQDLAAAEKPRLAPTISIEVASAGE